MGERENVISRRQYLRHKGLNGALLVLTLASLTLMAYLAWEGLLP